MLCESKSSVREPTAELRPLARHVPLPAGYPDVRGHTPRSRGPRRTEHVNHEDRLTL
jgi:hypothetical protein